MSRYAENTTVGSDRSRAEIEKTLARYGADQFMYGWGIGEAVIAFRADGRNVKFVLPMPDRNSREFTHTPARGNRRTDAQIEAEFEQAVRQRWRALALVIKAKLEAVEAGITVFEDEFLAHILLPDGSTIGEWARPQIDAVYSSGKMPELMPGSSR
jgi:hypothetical protein